MLSKTELLEIENDLTNGDYSRIGEIYEAMYKMYFSSFRGKYDPHLIEEAIQNAFIKILKKRTFNNKSARFFTWSRTIIMREMIDSLRRNVGRGKYHRKVDISKFEPSLKANSNKGEYEFDELEAIADAFVGLDKKHQDCIALAYWHEATQKEIAECTGIPIGTVKSRTTGAKKKLRRTYEEALALC